MRHFAHLVKREKATKRIVVSLSLLTLLWSGLADETQIVQCNPDWTQVTWETRYDQAKLARIRLNPKSLLPGQLAVIKQQEVTFTPTNGQEVTLDGGWKYGGYVFDSWDELLILLEHSVGGITIKQTPFTQNSNRQIFALSPGQQKILHSQKGILVLRVVCEMYKLNMISKFSLDAPTPVQGGGIIYQVVPAATKTAGGASQPTIDPTDRHPTGEVTYLNGKLVSKAEAIATLSGERATLDFSRKGSIDATDKRPGRALVYLLVNPEDHTANILQAVAPNGFFDPRRDPSKIDVIDHLGIPPDKTPLNHKILYVFDPLDEESTEVTLKNDEFMMHWP